MSQQGLAGLESAQEEQNQIQAVIDSMLQKTDLVERLEACCYPTTTENITKDQLQELCSQAKTSDGVDWGAFADKHTGNRRRLEKFFATLQDRFPKVKDGGFAQRSFLNALFRKVVLVKPVSQEQKKSAEGPSSTVNPGQSSVSSSEKQKTAQLLDLYEVAAKSHEVTEIYNSLLKQFQEFRVSTPTGSIELFTLTADSLQPFLNFPSASLIGFLTDLAAIRGVETPDLAALSQQNLTIFFRNLFRATEEPGAPVLDSGGKDYAPVVKPKLVEAQTKDVKFESGAKPPTQTPWRTSDKGKKLVPINRLAVKMEVKVGVLEEQLGDVILFAFRARFGQDYKFLTGLSGSALWRELNRINATTAPNSLKLEEKAILEAWPQIKKHDALQLYWSALISMEESKFEDDDKARSAVSTWKMAKKLWKTTVITPIDRLAVKMGGSAADRLERELGDTILFAFRAHFGQGFSFLNNLGGSALWKALNRIINTMDPDSLRAEEQVILKAWPKVKEHAALQFYWLGLDFIGASEFENDQPAEFAASAWDLATKAGKAFKDMKYRFEAFTKALEKAPFLNHEKWRRLVANVLIALLFTSVIGYLVVAGLQGALGHSSADITGGELKDLHGVVGGLVMFAALALAVYLMWRCQVDLRNQMVLKPLVDMPVHSATRSTLAWLRFTAQAAAAEDVGSGPGAGHGLRKTYGNND